MNVRIHDLDTDTSYVAKSEADCRDATDRSVYQEVCRNGDVITMGRTVGKPVRKAPCGKCQDIRDGYGW